MADFFQVGSFLQPGFFNILFSTPQELPLCRSTNKANAAASLRGVPKS
jgi:hypothetical protein